MEIYKIKIKMKHIRLYEFYSELPTSFSVADIQNMSETDFLINLKMLKDKGDEEQAFSLLQIWMNSHQDAKNNMSFMQKLGYIIPSAKEDDFFSNKARQKIAYQDSLKRPKLQEEIEEVKRSIKNYEEMLRMAKDRLAKLEFEITGTM